MTIPELVEAYKSGSLTDPLVIDNDSVGAYEHDDDWVNVTNHLKDIDPGELLEGLLDYLRIPWEHA